MCTLESHTFLKAVLLVLALYDPPVSLLITLQQSSAWWGRDEAHALTGPPTSTTSHLMRYWPSFSASAKRPGGKASPATACIHSRASVSRTGSYFDSN